MVNETLRHVYVDVSALVKLIVAEPESGALRLFLSSGPTLVSSRIAAVEVRRVVSRQDELDTDEQVQSLLDGVLFVEFDPKIAQAAAAVQPPSLRSLDAIHLASALSLADEVATVITYDHRLADAVRAAGLTVAAPT